MGAVESVRIMMGDEDAAASALVCVEESVWASASDSVRLSAWTAACACTAASEV